MDTSNKRNDTKHGKIKKLKKEIKKMVNVTKKIFNVALIFITIVATVFSVTFLYFTTIGKNNVPMSVTSVYATTITDPQTGEELPAIEANYFANKNNTGYEVTELLFNCYSGVSKQAVYSRGFQLCKNKDGEIIYYTENNEQGEIKSAIYQYNKSGDTSFETGHFYNWGDPMIIEIDDEIYAVKLDGKYKIAHKDFNTGKAILTAVTLGINLIFQDTNFYNEYETEHNYTFKDLLEKIGQILQSSSKGTGDSVIPLIDLGDFLHIYAYENGQISAEPLGGNTHNAFKNTYFTMAGHYDKRGMVWAQQSLFKSVAGQSDFNISGVNYDVEYWKAKTQCVITEKDFKERYVTSENGFYYSLSADKITELKNFENTEIIVDFNLSTFKNVNVLGFDNYALYGIKVKELRIKSNTQKEFKLLIGSLKETDLEAEQIQLQNITLNNVNSGVAI